MIDWNLNVEYNMKGWYSMSVVVKGMNMPKVGDKFEACVDASGNIFLHQIGSFDDIYYVEQLPKHGRLIDADALLKDYEEEWGYEEAQRVNDYWVGEAPTALEADE